MNQAYPGQAIGHEPKKHHLLAGAGDVLAQQARDKAPIHAAMDRLNRLIEESDAAIFSLEEMLTPVLKAQILNEARAGSDKVQQPPDLQSPMLTVLLGYCSAMEHHINRINAIRGRAEV